MSSILARSPPVKFMYFLRGYISSLPPPKKSLSNFQSFTYSSVFIDCYVGATVREELEIQALLSRSLQSAARERERAL